MPGVIVLIPVDCRCKRPNYRYNQHDGTFFCPSCGRTIRSISMEQVSGPIGKGPDLVTFLKGIDEQVKVCEDRLNDYIRQNTELESELTEANKHIEYLEKDKRTLLDANQALKKDFTKRVFLGVKRNDSDSDTRLKKRVETLEKDIKELATAHENDQACLKELTETNQDLANRCTTLSSELEHKEREILSWKGDYTVLNKEIRKLQNEIGELDSTNTHLRKKNEELSSIDIRTIVRMFLDFSSAVYNASLDKDSLESLRETVGARIQWLRMNAEGLGLHIEHHERGSELSDNVVDAEFKETDDESLKGKVKVSECMGCTFRSDSIANIPEKITVYTYNEPDQKGSDV